MASLRDHRLGAPFAMPLDDDGKVTVDEELLNLKFGFRLESMYVE